MLTQRAANIGFNLLMLALAAWFALVAEGFETSGLLAGTGLPSKFFPQLILGCMALCSLVVLALYLARGETGGDFGDFVFADFGEARRGILTLIVALACCAIWMRWGFVPMAIVLGPACALAMGASSVRMHLCLLAITGAVYVLFALFLGVQFA